ncbi:cyclic nucleotide-binding domain-containing protein [Nitrospina gracilis]|uniref:cyclic nucleotide-binding domain-containing protein n=1 Tax=Nitrospina gracilis TaxID=35801 RepID=UPI001F28D376|nr:cyclic nucleotide-binding domain-containing protein [Nitrospina gracilis]MCF8719622.1 CRP-like cAMP-binding protein [Nitrospina gracilis Nb-211]
MKTRQYLKEGQILFREGSQSDFIFVVEKGEFEVSRQNRDGRVEVIDVLRPDDIFGELGVIESRPRTATVRALKDGVVAIVSKEEMLRTVRQNPQALMLILKTMAQRVRQASQQGRKKVLRARSKYDLASQAV